MAETRQHAIDFTDIPGGFSPRVLPGLVCESVLLPRE